MNQQPEREQTAVPRASARPSRRGCGCGKKQHPGAAAQGVQAADQRVKQPSTEPSSVEQPPAEQPPTEPTLSLRAEHVPTRSAPWQKPSRKRKNKGRLRGL